MLNPLTRPFAVMLLAIALGWGMALPATAQDAPPPSYPANTITVLGSGSATGTPDLADINVGVRTTDPQVSAAFDVNNQTVQNVIDAVQAAGVAPEDIRTVGISAFQREDFNQFGAQGADPNAPALTFEVTNDLRIVVRDTAAVGTVITSAVDAGANNIYGLNFRFSNRAELEGQARAAAIADARAQAEAYAALTNVQLGEVLVINDAPNVFAPSPLAFGGGGGGGGGGAPIELGQLSVNVEVQVTYAIIR